MTIALITNYATLQAAILEWLARPDLTVAPNLIQLAEGRIRAVIRTRNTGIQTLATVAGTGTITIPSGIIEVRELIIDNSANNAGGSLDMVSLGQVYRERASRGNTTAMPTMANIADTVVTLAPIPDAVYTVIATCEGPFVPLSNSNTTNWIVSNYPHVYLYGALVESAPYLKDDDRMQLWETRFQQSLSELRDARERAEWPSSPREQLAQSYS